MREVVDKWVGRSVPRREDGRLLRGEGNFVGDIVFANMLHAAFARSQLPSARILSVELEAARTSEGVVFAGSGIELNPDLPPIPGLQVSPPKAWRDSVRHRVTIPDQPILAGDYARYVGEPYAVVLATDRYLAEDGVERIEVHFEPLPHVTNVKESLKPDAPRVHVERDSNIFGELRMSKGSGSAALVDAPRRLKREFKHHRYAAMPMECRGVAAQYDRRTSTLTIWSSTQIVHWVRSRLSVALGMPEDRIRCIAPDVGGGFGGKGHVYPEDVLIPYLAWRLDRPVKWIEDRHEHMLHSAHSRNQIHTIDVGFDETGRIHAIHDSFMVDSGAYSPVGIGSSTNTAAHLLGPYDIPHYEVSAKVIATNKTPNAPYRGAGRPEAVFAMERMMDLIAAELGQDPVNVRLRNMVKGEQMPYESGLTYRDGVSIVYDSGDYPKSLQRAIEELGGLAAFRERQATAWQEGRYLGLGLGCYVEGTGVGPFEGATVRIDPSGLIAVSLGVCSYGQGHETIFAQIMADAWKVPIDRVIVRTADTAGVSMGYGTIASRSTVTGAGAMMQANEPIMKKAVAIAAKILEATEEDLEIRDGGVGVKGVPDLHLSLSRIARAARPGWDSERPEGLEPGLEATAYYEPPTVTWAYAIHAAIMEVEPDTGRAKFERYVVVHDAGVLINPMLAHGQVLGGLVQGIGGGMYEEISYDEHGQLLTGSLMDYLIPSTCEAPPVTIIHEEYASPLNSLGVKGLGEGGAIAPPVVIANAVSDALRPVHAEFNTTPLRWESVLTALSRSTVRAAAS